MLGAFLASAILACNKEQEVGFDSVTGRWTYTTPDGKVMVTFDMQESVNGEVTVANLEYALDSTVYNSVQQVSGVDLPVIEKIRFNLNDAQAVYLYYIEFAQCTVGPEFDVITADSASYVYPWNDLHMLQSVQILRVE